MMSNSDVVDQPQVDQPQVDQPQVDQPQVDQPQVDQPQVDEEVHSSEPVQPVEVVSNDKKTSLSMFGEFNMLVEMAQDLVGSIHFELPKFDQLTDAKQMISPAIFKTADEFKKKSEKMKDQIVALVNVYGYHRDPNEYKILTNKKERAGLRTTINKLKDFTDELEKFSTGITAFLESNSQIFVEIEARIEAETRRLREQHEMEEQIRRKLAQLPHLDEKDLRKKQKAWVASLIPLVIQNCQKVLPAICDQDTLYAFGVETYIKMIQEVTNETEPYPMMATSLRTFNLMVQDSINSFKSSNPDDFVIFSKNFTIPAVIHALVRVNLLGSTDFVVFLQNFYLMLTMPDSEDPTSAPTPAPASAPTPAPASASLPAKKPIKSTSSTVFTGWADDCQEDEEDEEDEDEKEEEEKKQNVPWNQVVGRRG
jgi:hypothetical protein